MKKISSVLIVLLSVFLSGCSLSYVVKHEKIDDLENPYTINKVVFYQDNLFTVTLNKTTKDDWYSIDFNIYKDEWGTVEPDFITIKADDNIIKIRDSGYYRKDIISGNYIGTMSAILEEKDLLLLANARKLRIHFFGDPIDIDEKGISLIKRFYEEFK